MHDSSTAFIRPAMSVNTPVLTTLGLAEDAIYAVSVVLSAVNPTALRPASPLVDVLTMSQLVRAATQGAVFTDKTGAEVDPYVVMDVLLRSGGHHTAEVCEAVAAARDAVHLATLEALSQTGFGLEWREG